MNTSIEWPRLIVPLLLTASLGAQSPAGAASDPRPQQLTTMQAGADGALIYKSIIPPKLANDMFGRRIAREYLAIQVTIFNTDEQRNLLVNDVSIDYGALIEGNICGSRSGTIAATPNTGIGVSTLRMMSQVSNVDETGKSAQVGLICQTSSQELSILRGVAEKGQLVDPRNAWYRAFQAVGTLGGALTGVAGLGPVLPTAVAAFNGPGLSAYTTAFPDFTINQMNRLNDSAYAANTVVPAQRSKVMVAFVPLNLFFNKGDKAAFYKDVYARFQGVGTSGGLKDIRVRVSYNYIVSADDVPPILSTVAFDAGDVLGFLNKTDVHGVITGRFLDGANVSVTGADGLTIKLDPQRQSNDSRLYFVLTPKVTVAKGAVLTLKVVKGKQSASIGQTVDY